MRKKSKFGFLNQGYEAPRAESVEIVNQGVFCASSAPADDFSTSSYDVIHIP